MKTFISQNCEVAEVELTSAGLPVSQEGADLFIRQQNKALSKINRKYGVNRSRKWRGAHFGKLI